ncbi:cell division protein FtsL [Alteribacter natronophilus]|uniref:cell division protein FtsL n=1 Tax=Alteribacter natronophilus TaxID=2583810 RepID=UPI00110F1723|nr:cell division protein FtsL [Alteribacter natronophilus]TMW73119.1 cell division protein FtsL [Alteribacter natronophilus]
MSTARQHVHERHIQGAPHTETQTVRQRVFKGGLTKGEKILYPLALLAVVFAAYIVVSNYASIYIANHEIQQTEMAIADQSTVNEGLSLQVKGLSDPDRILSIAGEMGMTLNDQNVNLIQNRNQD